MLKLIFTIFLLFSFTSSRILADDFTGTGDNTGNRFYQTVAYTIGAYPSELTDHIVGYDQNDVVGMNVNTFFTTHTLSSITDFGGNRTISGVADRVSLPPRSRVDIVYVYHNKAGHDINVSHILLPISAGDGENSSLLDIVSSSVPPTNFKVDIRRDGVIMSRAGKYLQLGSNSRIRDNASNRDSVASFYIKNPLEIKDIHATKVGKSAKVTLTVSNITKEYLRNIYFEHHGYTEEFDLAGMEERYIEYVLENILDTESLEVDLSSATIRNPNSIKRCAVGEEENYRLLGLYTTPVFAYRLDGGYAIGAMTAPDMGNFCVTVIPYTMSSESILVSNPPEEDSDDDNNGEEVGEDDNDTVESSDEEVVQPTNVDGTEDTFVDSFENNDVNKESVLGVSGSNRNLNENTAFILPKTFVRHWWVLALLVVDVYLWYSYFRKRKIYENQNEDTKICTESSKDTHR